MSQTDDVASWMALRPGREQANRGGWLEQGPLEGLNEWWSKTGSMFACGVPELNQVCTTTKRSVDDNQQAYNHYGSDGQHRHRPPFAWQPEPHEAPPNSAADQVRNPRMFPPSGRTPPHELHTGHGMKILMVGSEGHQEWKQRDNEVASGNVDWHRDFQNPSFSPASAHDSSNHGLTWERKLMYSSMESSGSRRTAFGAAPSSELRLPEPQAFESFTVSRAEAARLSQVQVTPRYHRLDGGDRVQDSNPQLTIPEHEYISPLPTREFDSAPRSWIPQQPKVLQTKLSGVNLDGSFKIEADLVELAATPRETPQHLQVV